VGEFRGQTERALWQTGSALRFKSDFALTAINNDLLPGPRLGGANLRCTSFYMLWTNSACPAADLCG
jgi:hypothetical protein